MGPARLRESAYSPVAVFVFGMNTRRIGGIEVHTRELVGRLASRGWQAVLCFHQPPGPAVRQYLSLPNVTWEVLPYAWHNSWQASRSLLRILRRHRPRLLHLQFTPFLSFNAWLARLAGVSRIVSTDHHSNPEGYFPEREPFWMRVVGRCLNRPVSVAVAVSEYKRGTVARLGTFQTARLHIVYNGVDFTRRNEVAVAAGIDFRTRHRIPSERVLIMQISQIIPEKGIPDLLDAAHLALLLEPKLHFVFVGDGEYLSDYMKQSVELGLSDNVTWTGLVSDPMAEGAFAASDIVCLASRWEEAFGFVIAEAMSWQKPVVATRVGAISELVEDGKTGFLVFRRDPAALAEKFALLARDPSLRLRLGRAGHDRAAALFDVRINVGKLLELYDVSFSGVTE